MDSTVVLIWIVCAIIAGAIGSTKGRTAEGVLLGILLGAIGVVLILVWPAKQA